MIYEKYIRVLNIDLERQKINIELREDLAKYLGGVGVASKLLEEKMRPELPVLDPAQPIVFAIGPLSTIFPVMTKTVAMFLSPLTGELGESYAGGRLAMALFDLGYDAVVITGMAKHPVYLAISPNDVKFRDARSLWKTGNDTDTSRIIRDREPGGGKRSIIRIGPAGENLVSYASVCVDTYRHFGRLGLGAVMGSKKLKAISVVGGRSIPIKNVQKYFRVYRKIFEKCEGTESMAKYHDAGTPINIEPLNKAGGLPTRNLQQNRFESADMVSGDAFARESLVRKMACVGCPVGCIHIGRVRRQFADDGYEYETINTGYDYELIYALGTFLGVGTPDTVLELVEEAETAGIDAMSAGVALGYATEALSHGLITEQDTGVPLVFGDWRNYKKAIRLLSRGETEFYKALGKGVKYCAGVYGGYDFAMQLGGNEMAGYHTGYGAIVGAAVGARHSHLCNGGYALDQSSGDLDEDAIVTKLLTEEIERCMVNSLVMCLFARKVYDRPTILEAMHAIDFEITDEELSAAAMRNYLTKLRIKRALGYDPAQFKFPKRFFETESLRGMLNEETADRLVQKFRAKTLALLEEDECK